MAAAAAAPLVVAAAPIAKEAFAALSKPLFTLSVDVVRGTKKRPMPMHFALHPSLLDVGFGIGAVLAAWAFYVWASRPLIENLLGGGLGSEEALRAIAPKIPAFPGIRLF